MVTPILLYGSEVWGCEAVTMLDKFQIQFCKQILKLKQCAPSCMVYGDLGIMPVSLLIKMRVLNYWCKVINCKDSKINNILYRTAFSLYEKSDVKLPWLRFVHDTLNSIGLTYIWNQQCFGSNTIFKNLIKRKLQDQYLQSWNSKMNESAKCLNYRLYKQSFEFENYLDILPMHLAKFLCKFRCCNHKLPIEEGRFFGIDRADRICNLCNMNVLGDEFHYLLQCRFFDVERKKYIQPYFFTHTNVLKFYELMNTKDYNLLVKLSIFCKKNVSAFP